MKDPICYCGHDCSRCVTYLATVRSDPSLRAQAREFYRSEFGKDLPEPEIRCTGGRTEDRFVLCRECPFSACCAQKGIDSCAKCGEFPCELLKRYREKYVNRCNQI